MFKGLAVRQITVNALVFALAFSVVTGVAGESAATSKPQEIKQSELPEYTYAYRNGFYATIIGYNTIKDFSLPQLQDFRLQVDGFNCSVPVRAIVQPGQAPLVFVLLGAEGRALDPLAKRWVSLMSDSGWHVVCFNSTLQKDFVGQCGRGVSGHILTEAECVRDIISSALKSPYFEGKVSQLGVVGMSYGGIQALLLGKLGQEKKLPFTIDAIQAYSPPVDMMHSAELLDRWWREDRYQFTLPEIYYKVAKHKPVAPGACIPFSESLMKASLAASFRLEMIDIVDVNDDVYDLNILPRASNAEERVRRQDYAATWGFTRFMRNVSFPYWKDRLKMSHFGEFNAEAKLCDLVTKLPSTAEIIITDDDPLNLPEDFEAFKKCASAARVTYLTGGGHVGYTNEPWTQAKVMSLFKK